MFTVFSLLLLKDEYLNYCEKYPVYHTKCIRSHILKMLYRYISVHTDIRNNCGNAHTMDDFRALIRDIRQRVADEDAEGTREILDSNGEKKDKYWISWYNRHRFEGENGEEKKPIITKDDLLNLKTSFLRGGDDEMWCVAEEENNAGGGIFGAMFGGSE